MGERKYENYQRALAVLVADHDAELADGDDIYRMGIIGQFNLCFELAWKLLQVVLRLYGVSAAESGSPRAIIKLGFQVGFLDDEAVWLEMLRQRNTATHVCDGAAARAFARAICDDFLPVLVRLRGDMRLRLTAAREDSL